MTRILQRAKHLFQRIENECKAFPQIKRTYGFNVASATFKDGLVPPGKSEKYISTIQEYVDKELSSVIKLYNTNPPKHNYRPKPNANINDDKMPIWCCWWQGVESMPEIVKMCHTRLKQVIPKDKTELHIITFDNYKDYVDIPEHILEKFNKGIVTMTTMSDVLRFCLLERYGGYWLDATVFFTDDIPEEYFTRDFYCQKMTNKTENVAREACKCNWCGFSMHGEKDNILFRYMVDAFSHWWSKYDSVLIDYMLMSGYKHIPAITKIIDTVENNNEDIFELYKYLNEPYSDKLLKRFTDKNVMHKLTYKMELKKKTDDGKLTLYGHLLNEVYSK